MADSDDKGKKPKASAPAKAKQVAPKYDRAEHIDLARGMHKEPPHVVAGALAMLDEKADEPKQELSKGEVKSAIAKFKTRKVSR